MIGRKRAKLMVSICTTIGLLVFTFLMLFNANTDGSIQKTKQTMAKSDSQYLISDLDAILDYMAGPRRPSDRSYGELLTEVRTRKLIEDRETLDDYILTIILKLTQDGYLRPVRNSGADPAVGDVYDSPNDFMYQITWNGINFSQTGGYTSEIYEKSRMSRLEKGVKKIAVAAFILSLITLLFSGVTLALKIWEDFYKDNPVDTQKAATRLPQPPASAPSSH